MRPHSPTRAPRTSAIFLSLRSKSPKLVPVQQVATGLSRKRQAVEVGIGAWEKRPRYDSVQTMKRSGVLPERSEPPFSNSILDYEPGGGGRGRGRGRRGQDLVPPMSNGSQGTTLAPPNNYDWSSLSPRKKLSRESRLKLK